MTHTSIMRQLWVLTIFLIGIVCILGGFVCYFLFNDSAVLNHAGSNTLFMIGSLSFLTLVLGFFYSIGALKKLKSSIEVFLNETSKSSQNISLNSKKLSFAQQQFLTETLESTVSIQQVTVSLSELFNMVRFNNENAKNIFEFHMQNFENTKAGEKEMAELEQALQEVSNSSKKMEVVVGLFDELAFQTNLLALEATRAGEPGRAFNIIAESFRTLAEQSAAASKETGLIVKEILKNIEAGAHKFLLSKKILNELFNSAEEVSQLNDRFAMLDSEESDEFKRIGILLNQLNLALPQSAAKAQEISHYSNQMFNETFQMSEFFQKLNYQFFGDSVKKPSWASEDQIMFSENQKSEEANTSIEEPAPVRMSSDKTHPNA
jgi:methyl-accepting chemotaxis protein